MSKNDLVYQLLMPVAVVETEFTGLLFDFYQKRFNKSGRLFGYLTSWQAIPGYEDI